MENQYILDKEKVGFIAGFHEGAGKTGYQVEMLIRGREVRFDCTKEAFDYQYTTVFFPYPCLGEIIFSPQFDDNGILTSFLYANDIAAEGNLVKTGLVLGTYAMFKVKLTETTPSFGEFMVIENNVVTLTENFDRFLSEGTICHCVYGGSMPRPHGGLSFKLADDVVAYVWDWSSTLTPFHKCSREEAIANKFVTRFSVGSVKDYEKAYWGGFYSTRGDDVIDLIKFFWNKPPGWM